MNNQEREQAIFQLDFATAACREAFAKAFIAGDTATGSPGGDALARERGRQGGSGARYYRTGGGQVSEVQECERLKLERDEARVARDFANLACERLEKRLKEAEAELQKREAACATMRSTIRVFLDSVSSESDNYVGGLERIALEAATSHDCGQPLLDRLKELEARLHAAESALETAKEALDVVLKSAVHPDKAIRSVMVPLDPIRKALAAINAVTTKPDQRDPATQIAYDVTTSGARPVNPGSGR